MLSQNLKKCGAGGSGNCRLRHKSVYTFDTNVIIYYLDRDGRVLPIVHEIFERNSPVYVSTVSEIELFGFPRLTDEEAAEIDDVLRTVSLIPLDSRIARLAAALRKNHGLKIADSAIAATALFTGSTLLTRNVKDFRRVSELKLQNA